MRGKVPPGKKPGVPQPAGKKAGGAPAKKAGAPGKLAGLVPRDFMVAQQTMHNLIDDYADIVPLQATPKPPTLRDLIKEAIISGDFLKLQMLERDHGDRFLSEVHKTACNDAVLVLCARHHNLRAMELLLARKVDPNQTASGGETALHAAVRAEFEAGLVLLHNYSAVVWLSDVAGNTPFLLASVQGAEGLILRLVDFGASPWKRDGTGKIEIEYIADEKLRKRVAAYAYWHRKRSFAWCFPRSNWSRLSSNLAELVSTYL